MRIESALYSGKAGLMAHGQAISVIGDNIANSNTTGFKSSRVEFADLLSEGLEGRQSTTLAPVGSGVAVNAVRQMFEGGLIEPTGRQLDAGIDGEGFFMCGDVTNPYYSRAGNFFINSEGLLVNSDGETVLGLLPGGTALSTINMYAAGTASGVATSMAKLVGNLDAQSSATAVSANPQSFNEIARLASYVTGFSVYDSLGQMHNVTLAFFKTGANAWTAQAYMDGADVGGMAGVPVQIGGNAALTFTSAGTIDPASAAAAVITAAPNYSNGAAAGNFAINLASFTQYAAPSSLASVTQDGKGVGNVKGYEIQSDGRILAIMDSGTTQTIATIQLANFGNKDGLDRVGNTMFRADETAGERVTGSPGTGALGKLVGGALERSTVDIASQFVELVLYQRGYQANSQTFSVASDMIRETIQLMR